MPTRSTAATGCGRRSGGGPAHFTAQLNDQLRVSDSLRGQDFFLPPAQPQADWPVAGGSLEQSVEHVAAAPDFQIAWRRSFGAKSARHADVMAPPIIADGKIFVMDGNAGVSAHDAKTGAQLWRVDLRPKVKHDRDREGFGGGLAYSDGKIYAASGFRLVAELDASSGHVDWLTRTDAPRARCAHRGGRPRLRRRRRRRTAHLQRRRMARPTGPTRL